MSIDKTVKENEEFEAARERGYFKFKKENG